MRVLMVGALACVLSSFGWQAAAQDRTGAAQAPSSSSAETPLTNSAVVKLVRAGFSEKTVIAIIRSRPARFDLSPDRLIELKKGGVSEKVILAMLARGEETELASEEWGDQEDEAFFGRGGAPRQSGAGDPGEVNIFGSSGGSSGRVRSRTGGGGSSGETTTMGSASVRIVRPPAESGGAPPLKLERTPTLTNEAVIELVEAGFSEGTILRRIEQSPAGFDLTPAKVEELRRRRVSEGVITAMRAAMSDENQPARRPEK